MTDLIPDKTIYISEDEYYKLQKIADIMRRDYLAVTLPAGTQDAADALLATATADEWKKAIEDLDGIGS